MIFFRSKINPSNILHRAIIFGQKFTGPQAEYAGIIDKTVPPSMVLQESQRVITQWIGKNGFPRDSLQNMKIDLYADALSEIEDAKL